YYPIFFFLAISWFGKKNKWANPILILSILFFIFSSGRRLNYLLLLLGVIGIIVVGIFNGDYTISKLIKNSKKLTVYIIVILICLILLLPNFGQSVAFAFKTLDMSSKVGQAHGGDIRVAEIKNLFLNMNQRPYTYIFGFGLGTKWKEIIHQPMDSYTFQQKYLEKAQAWFPQFHLPFISTLYRFGFLGTILLLTIVVRLVLKYIRQIRKTHSLYYKSHFMAMSVFIFLTLINIGDSLNPTMPIMAGFLIGLLEAYQRHNLDNEY
ncbi:MAG: hypothetical protein ACE5JB_11880, partial [bacterium]